MNERRFSWFWLRWTDTGERPAPLCVAIALFLGSMGYSSIVDGHTGNAIMFLLCAGMNIGMIGTRDSRYDRRVDR